MNTPRTIIIGLDGATFDILDPLVRGGYLPTFQRLMNEGTRATLNAFPNMNSAAAWSSLVTGYNAGEHGIFHFDANWYRLSQKGIKTHPTTGADRRRDPFWRILSRAGQRVGVMNVPISYPAEELNGFVLAGMDTPGIHSKGFCYPASLYDELTAQNIPYEIDTFNLARPAHEHPYDLPEQIKRMTEARGRALLYLMDMYACDVVMGVFIATDRVQHFFWHDENADASSASWKPLRELYQQLDDFLAQLMTRLDANTTLLLVSDHGFGRKRRALHALNELFARWGLLGYSEHASDTQGALLARALQYGRRLVPLSLQYPLARLFPALHLRALTAGGFANVDWARTKLFADPDGWGVYVNLQGREPEGIVPQAEYEPLRQAARERLLALRDGQTNKPILSAVHDRETMFHGPFLEHAPDLMLEWDFETAGDSFAYDDHAERIVVEPSHSFADEKWKAAHRPDGILIGYGAHIPRGQTLANVSLYDIAPTVLHLQGQPIPMGMDGRVVTELLTPEVSRTHPIAFTQAETGATTGQEAEEPQDIHLVEERLRALGYLEDL